MIDVNKQRLTQDWSKLKGQVKEQWGKLTDDDLLVIAGQREQLLAKIREHYHVAAEEAEQQVRKWEEKIGLGSTGS